MSDPKKELTPEQLSKVAGGKGSSTSNSRSSSHSAKPTSSSSFSAHRPPMPHRTSSSTSK